MEGRVGVLVGEWVSEWVDSDGKLHFVIFDSTTILILASRGRLYARMCDRSKVVAKQLVAEAGKTKCTWWARVDGKTSDMHCAGTRDVLPRRRVITGHRRPTTMANTGQYRPTQACVGGG